MPEGDAASKRSIAGPSATVRNCSRMLDEGDLAGDGAVTMLDLDAVKG